MAELTITQLRNLDQGDSSLLLAVDGEKETFNLSFNTLYQYIQERLGFLETGCAEMFLGEVVPETHTELDGKSFDPLVFPKMGALFPDGILPDTRGMILKHAPNGRFALSFEAGEVKSHDHAMDHKHSAGTLNASGAFDDYSKLAGASGVFVKQAYSQSTTSLVHGTGYRVTIDLSRAWSGKTSTSDSSRTGRAGASKNTVDNIAVKFIIKKA